MTQNKHLEELITEVHAELKQEEQGQAYRSDALTTIVTVLVTMGLKTLLPELKEWAKLAGTASALIRQEIEKRLEAYAKSKELDMDKARKVAKKIAEKINDKNIKQLTEGLEGDQDEE